MTSVLKFNAVPYSVITRDHVKYIPRMTQKREYKITLISIVVLKYVSNSHREDMLLNTDILFKCLRTKKMYNL